MRLDQSIITILGTYAMHSTLAVLGAWLVTGPLKLLKEPRAVRGTWKLALFLPLVSGSFQLLAAHVPPAWVTLGTVAAPAAAASGPVLSTPPLSGSVASSGPAFVAPAWTVIVSMVWALGLAFGLWKLSKGELALRRMLRGREEVLEDHAVDALIAFRQRAQIKRRIRLSVSDSLSTPVAVGRSEIVLSRHALDELPPEQLAGVIGHELAHLEARDPWWARGIALLEALAFFQPLNYWAKAKHRDAAELAADDWSRRFGSSGESLARALAEIAASSPKQAVPAWAQAARGGSLVRRVERLLAEPQKEGHVDAAQAARSQGMPRVAAGLGALVVMTLFAPRIGFAQEPNAAPPMPAAHFELAATPRTPPTPPTSPKAAVVVRSSSFGGGHAMAFAHPHPGHGHGHQGESVVIADDGQVIRLHLSDGDDRVRVQISGEWAEEMRAAGEEIRRELDRELGPEMAEEIRREVLEELEAEGIVIDLGSSGAEPHRDTSREAQREASRAQKRAQRATAEARREAKRARKRAEAAQRQAERAIRQAEQAAERQRRAQEKLERKRSQGAQLGATPTIFAL